MINKRESRISGLEGGTHNSICEREQHVTLHLFHFHYSGFQKSRALTAPTWSVSVGEDDGAWVLKFGEKPAVRPSPYRRRDAIQIWWGAGNVTQPPLLSSLTHESPLKCYLHTYDKKKTLFFINLCGLFANIGLGT